MDFLQMLAGEGQGSPRTIDVQNKRTIILTMKNVSDILDLDTKKAYDEALDSEGTFIQYQTDD